MRHCIQNDAAIQVRKTLLCYRENIHSAIMTQLLYLEQMHQLTCEATVTQVFEKDSRFVIVLDQTVFYPQGGGQPYDRGVIKTHDEQFVVEEVRFVDGEVLHIGHFMSEPFTVGETVHCQVEKERRELHARLHSGGHLVDLALHRLGKQWEPAKGYHFPDGPYVEYEGTLEEGEGDVLRTTVEKTCNDIIQEDISTKVVFMDKSAMPSVCQFVPDYLPEGKPGRVVLFGDFGIPCGGTHVQNLSEIAGLSIRKIKQHKDIVRVAYSVND